MLDLCDQVVASWKKNKNPEELAEYLESTLDLVLDSMVKGRVRSITDDAASKAEQAVQSYCRDELLRRADDLKLNVGEAITQWLENKQTEFLDTLIRKTAADMLSKAVERAVRKELSMAEILEHGSRKCAQYAAENDSRREVSMHAASQRNPLRAGF